MSSLIRKRGDLWVAGEGYLVQSHATWREAAESLGAVRRIRQQVKNRVANQQGIALKNSVTVMKRCVYNACTSKQCDETQLGFCAYHDGQARKYLASHRQYAGRSGCTPRITDLRKK